MEEDEFLDILLSQEEARATWDRLLGEEDGTGTTPAGPQPAARPAPGPTTAAVTKIGRAHV